MHSEIQKDRIIDKKINKMNRLKESVMICSGIAYDDGFFFIEK